MSNKKTKVITIRIPPSTKQAILRETNKREWSPSKMAEKVLSSWAEQQKNTVQTQ